MLCKQVSCVEDAVQVRRRRYGPASDAEFLRSVADKTPGRDDGGPAGDRRDHQHQMMRGRQVYLKSYVFVTKEEEARKATTTRGPRALVDAVVCGLRLPSTLLRRRKAPRRDDAAAGSNEAAAVSSSGARCAKKAGKVLSRLLARLLASCTCNPASSSSSPPPPPSSSSSRAGAAAAAASVRRHSPTS